MIQENVPSTLPDLLCIGFFCHDLHDDKHILGGTASYCSLMAAKLQKKTAVLTSVGADFQFHPQFEAANIQVENKLAAKTTVFENIYHDGERTQYLHHRAKTLTFDDLPDAWKAAPVVKFCLIADEVDYDLLHAFPNALLGATIQGWLRQWDNQGKVSPKAMNWEQLAAVDVILMSKDDIRGFEAYVPRIVELVKVVVITDGHRGVTIYEAGKEYFFPCYPVEEVDPTGAGDIFAISFLLQFAESKSISKAVAFAHVAASFVVEGVGVHLPSISSIESRLVEYLELYK